MLVSLLVSRLHDPKSLNIINNMFRSLDAGQAVAAIESKRELKSYFVAPESNPAHARNRIEFSKSSRPKWRDPLGAAKFGLAALHQRFGKQGSKKVTG